MFSCNLSGRYVAIGSSNKVLLPMQPGEKKFILIQPGEKKFIVDQWNVRRLE
jgi:hypothetical protein